ncbi:hypothetical protein IFT48_35345 [Pseudomonas fluorescens]|uniref:hypothetical protein n=1 Tax=Pseudomonas fluorescens TaxID=294 RepID=UPI001906116B|nr:hypothetical protein [Pseudomonas fluorescens]MBD8095282.1 hypothetical protein [Pseudomonas fluorescens]MBD8719739.1 hypothetical protein [Pseudomonas fluorescens]
MSENSQEDLESSLVTLEEKLPALVQTQNPFWKSTPQFQALLTESGVPGGVKPTSAARRFTPENLTYLRLIYIYGDKPEKISKDTTVTIKVSGKDPYQAAVQHNQYYAFVWVQRFCEWFDISSTTLLLKPQIKKIELYGANQEQLTKYAGDIEAVIELKRTIAQFKLDAKSEISDANDLIAGVHAAKSELETEIESITTHQQKIKAESEKTLVALESSRIKLQQIELETKHFESKSVEAKNNTEQLTQQAENLNKSIADLKTQLQKLTNDRNLISDEYGPYVEEGKSQAKIYFALIVLPLLAIIFSTYQVYVGAGNLLTAEYKSAIDVLAAFILRIPFAAIFGLAIFYSWKLAHSMIQKIFKIHGDRLILAKLLVVARETVHSSAKHLNITDHEKFQEQTALKIEVLKSHMARDLSEDFAYKPISAQKNTTSSNIQVAVNDQIEIKDAVSP